MIINATQIIQDHRRRELWPERVKKIVLHRCLLKNGDVPVTNAIETCRRFILDPEVAEYTGGEIPYHIMIEKNRIVQVLEFGEKGTHARRFNAEAIGVAVMADPRFSMLETRQGGMMVQTLAWLCAWAGGVHGVLYGHDELDGASKDPDKRCPGKYVSMNSLRNEIGQILIDTGTSKKSGTEIENAMIELGFIF